MHRFFFFFLILSASFCVLAEESTNLNAKVAPSEAAKQAESPLEKENHHFFYFKPNLAVSFVNNRYVSGKTDGIYFSTDLEVLFNYKYKRRIHEFLTDLNIREGASYTPMFDGFVIASDLAKLELRYNAMFHKIVGYYLKANLETHFFPGYDYREDLTDYKVDGVRKSTDKKYRLTPSGLPLLIYQGTGIYVRPVDKKFGQLEINTGLLVREAFVGDSLKIDDDDATSERELVSMRDIYEAGGEAGFTFKGLAEEDKIGYEIKAKAIMPFYSKARKKLQLSWSDLFQFDAGVKVDFKVNRYIAFNYEFTLKRDFSIIKKWQMTNAMYLSLFYELNKAI